MSVVPLRISRGTEPGGVPATLTPFGVNSVKVGKLHWEEREGISDFGTYNDL